jgi:hypothetical protein
MTDEKFKKYKTEYNGSPDHISFWTNLKQGFDKFNSDKKLLNISVEPDGDYFIKS